MEKRQEEMEVREDARNENEKREYERDEGKECLSEGCSEGRDGEKGAERGLWVRR